MKTQADFNKETERLGTWSDPCVTLQNLEGVEVNAAYWNKAFYMLQDEAAERMLEAGIDPKQFNLTY